jgi:uncharacterized peroxidase-related enzyme
MTFIRTIDEADATGAVKGMYDQARAAFGYLPNMTRLFSHRPEVNQAWVDLVKAVRGGTMDLRRYELVTIAAARALTSSNCMLAHGSILLREGFAPAALAAIAEDFRTADLSPAEKAMMAFAEKIVRDATAVTRADIEGLRSHGFSDTEIFDIAAAAAMRCFSSKLLDALGATPDPAYRSLPAALREALTVGRPIAD